MRWWLLVAGLAMASLVVVLIGVTLLDDPSEPCACTPLPPSPTATPSPSF
jgi:hypothetical protein